MCPAALHLTCPAGAVSANHTPPAAAMPPKRALKRKHIRSQTFMHPYKFRPVAISLPPADIEIDIEVMNALLVAQRAALQRTFEEHAHAAAAAPAHAVHAHAGAAAAASDSLPANASYATSEDEHEAQQQYQQQHQFVAPSRAFQFGQQPLAVA